jgi:glycosyltransferase involved in cell wall biosynthesis
MKLTDRSVWNHISPIVSLDIVEEIHIIRDRHGPEINKVRYTSPRDKRPWSALLMVPAKFYYLVRFSLTEKPALIHSYLLFPHGFLALIAGKITRRKVGVSLIAGPVEAYVFGGSPIGTYAYCHPFPPPNFRSRFLLSILKMFDVITVTGTYTKKFLVARGIDEFRIFVLPHVVDDRFRPSGVEKDIDVLFVGRLVPVKHVETLILAVAMVRESRPSIRVAIVGEGESRSELEDLTDKLGLNYQIEFAGYQENAWDWYNRSRLSVVPSEREGFPYTVIESLKCGVPVITSNCGDVIDVVEDSYNGRLIAEYQDYAAFAEAILGLLQNPEQIVIYSKNGLEMVRNLCPESVGTEWNKILSSIV